MELRQLKYFVKAAETLNFSEAAKAMFVTQSTLSQQIRQLEIELDTCLFQRNNHSVMLTESGEAILPQAIKTIQDAEMCRNQIYDLQSSLSGTLNIGVTYSFSMLLTEAVIEFVKLHPKLKLNIFYKNPEQLMEMLKKKEVDVVIAFKPNQTYDDIESHFLFDNRLAVIVRKDHKLAAQESTTIDDIKQYSIAMPSRVMQARSTFDACFPNASDSLDIRVELNEVQILLELVKRSDMITILSEATIAQSTGLKALPIDTPTDQMEGCVHLLKKTYRKRAVKEFLELLSETEVAKKRAQEWLNYGLDK